MDNNSERITLTRVDVEQGKTVTSSARPFDFAINGTQVIVNRATGTGDKAPTSPPSRASRVPSSS